MGKRTLCQRSKVCEWADAGGTHGPLHVTLEKQISWFIFDGAGAPVAAEEGPSVPATHIKGSRVTLRAGAVERVRR